MISCPRVYPLAAYVFFLVLIFPLSFLQCLKKGRCIVPSKASAQQMSICCFVFQFPEQSPCRNVYLVAAYAFFFIFILPLHFLQCVTKVGPSPFQNLFSTEVDLLIRISVSPKIPCPQFYPVAAYVFFFILIFILSFRRCLTTVWCIVNSKATSSQRSMWPVILLVRSYIQ